MEGSATKKALLELRKKINEKIAEMQEEDPEAVAEGEADADEAMHEDSESIAEETDEHKPGGYEEGEEESDIRRELREYMNPKPKAPRPGTAMMIAIEKKPMSKNGRFGKLPKKDYA